MGAGQAFFPAASLSYLEECDFNFGSRPFLYPVEGYEPLQPPSVNLAQSRYLVSCLGRLLLFWKYPQTQALQLQDQVLVSAHIFQQLGPLLSDQFVTASVLYPFLASVSVEDLNILLDLFFTYLEPHELDGCFTALFRHIEMLSRSACIHRHDTGQYTFNLEHLELLNNLLAYEKVLQLFLSHPGFMTYMTALISWKSNIVPDVKALLPEIYVNEHVDDAEVKTRFEEDKTRLHAVYQDHQVLLTRLIGTFLNDHEVRVMDTLSGNTLVVRPQMKFLAFLRRLLSSNVGRNTPHTLTDLDVLIKLFFVLMEWLKTSGLWSSALADFPSHLFTTDRSDFFNTERLGGLLTHIRKEYPMNVDELPQVSQPVVELFDSVLYLAFLGLNTKLRTYIYHQANTKTALSDLQRVLEKKGARSKLEGTLFHQNAQHSIRLWTWHAFALTEHNIDLCLEQLVFVTNLLTFLAPTPLFPYLPMFYVRYFIDCVAFLLGSDSQRSIKTIDDELLSLIVHFVGQNFRHPHVVLPDLKEQMGLLFYELLDYPRSIAVIESDVSLRSALCPSLLSNFSGPQWPPVCVLMLRLFHGLGFGDDPESPSAAPLLRTAFGELLGELEVREKFLLKAFENMSWTTSELMIALEECDKTKNELPVVRKQALKKAKTLAEWTWCLLQLLELLALLQPHAFDKKANLNRLAELIVVIINRSTTGPNSSLWHQFTDALSQDMSSCLLAPVAGLLIALSSDNSFLEALVNTTGFRLDGFQSLDREWLFTNARSVTQAEPQIEKLKKLLSLLGEQESKADALNDSAEMCAICCASPLDTTMLPCNHRCCRDCLDRHLQTAKTCFFCKGVIQAYRHDDNPTPIDVSQPH